MLLYSECLPGLDARWSDLPGVDLGGDEGFECLQYIGVFRGGDPIFWVAVHDAPSIESWRDARCLPDVVLIGGYRRVHRVVVSDGPRPLPAIPMDGYFSGFHVPEDFDAPEDAFAVLAVGCSQVIRFDAEGEVVWSSDRLGIDGVVLHRMVEDRIVGDGEWDPPGGWQRFEIDLKTGDTLVASPSRTLFGGLPRTLGPG